MLKKTKIICTIGPASLSKEILQRMHQAGMNGARINTAYGTLDQYKLIADNVRETADIPVIVDIKGPEIRLQARRNKTVNKGDILKVGHNNEEISFNHNFYNKMSIGDNIYIDNGRIKTRVVKKHNESLHLLVINGGEISDGKGVNIPNKQLSVPSLSKKDLKVVDFAIEYEADFIALSFTRSVQDLYNLKSEADGFVRMVYHCRYISALICKDGLSLPIYFRFIVIVLILKR